MPTPFLTTRRVEFGDTDMAGIMHFANFFRFMEVAESDFLRGRGLTVSWVENGMKFGFPRVSVSCDFTRPVRFHARVKDGVLPLRLALQALGEEGVLAV